jgi:hypothetical protein
MYSSSKNGDVQMRIRYIKTAAIGENIDIKLVVFSSLVVKASYHGSPGIWGFRGCNRSGRRSVICPSECCCLLWDRCRHPEAQERIQTRLVQMILT